MNISNLSHAYSGLNRSIYILFAARVVNRIGDFVQLFLVLYLTQTIGFSESEAGRFIMMAGMMHGLGVLLGGHMADRFSRKHVLVFCQAVFALCYLACGFCTTSMAVPWLIFFSSAFRGATWPVTNAMVVDLTEGEERKKAFSLLYLGTNIGVSIGPIIAGFLFNSYLSWLFWGDALTTMLAAAAVMLYVKDTKPTTEEIEAFSRGRTDGERAEEGRALMILFRRPVLVAYLVLAILSSFVYAQHSFSLPLQMNDLFGENGARFYGYIMTVNAVTVLLSTAFLTHITYRNRPIANLTIASFLYAAGFGSILYVSRMPMFLAVTFVWTVGEILMVTNSNVFVARHTPITHRGRFNSIISFVYGIGYMVCPWVSGMIVESHGLRYIWPVAGVVGIVSTMLFALMWQILKRREPYAAMPTDT